MVFGMGLLATAEDTGAGVTPGAGAIAFPAASPRLGLYSNPGSNCISTNT